MIVNGFCSNEFNPEMTSEEWKLKRKKRFILTLSNPNELGIHKKMLYKGRIAVTASGRTDYSNILDKWLNYEIEPIFWFKNGQKKTKFILKNIIF